MYDIVTTDNQVHVWMAEYHISLNFYFDIQL